MQQSILDLPAVYSIEHRQYVWDANNIDNCYFLWCEGNLLDVYGSKDDAIKAAYKYSVIVD